MPSDTTLAEFVSFLHSFHSKISRLRSPETTRSHRPKVVVAEEKPAPQHVTSTPPTYSQPLSTSRSVDGVLEETTSSYNLRHKNSTQSCKKVAMCYSSLSFPLIFILSPFSYFLVTSNSQPPSTPTTMTSLTSSPLPPTSPSSPFVPTPSTTPGALSVSPPPPLVPLTPLLDKNSYQNAILECPFCNKRGFCGLSGIRTHIRNYCSAIDKTIWREKFTVGTNG